jgi:hypothetical protein
MEGAGKDAAAVRFATGWERGADGKWRYEIPDVKIKTAFFDSEGEWHKLSDVVTDNGGLFAAYPAFKDITVSRQRLEQGVDGIASLQKKL